MKLLGPNNPTLYSIYLNANNLYGHSVWFKLFFPEKISFDIYGGDGSIDCFLEVDLDYPDELHDLHNYYPLAVGKVKVFKKMLSDYHYKS